MHIISIIAYSSILLTIDNIKTINFAIWKTLSSTWRMILYVSRKPNFFSMIRRCPVIFWLLPRISKESEEAFRNVRSSIVRISDNYLIIGWNLARFSWSSGTVGRSIGQTESMLGEESRLQRSRWCPEKIARWDQICRWNSVQWIIVMKST